MKRLYTPDTNTRPAIAVAALLLALLLPVSGGAQTGDEPFVVSDFRVEGAQRYAEGTIYNYLPINIGDTVDATRVREAIRALYATGFFRDVELRRDGDTLVIAVLERPVINEFTFSGNKDIKTEDLERSLGEIGLARGRAFDRSMLEDVTHSLTEEYYARGKYGASVTPTVEELGDNRVRVSIEIEEGAQARIRQVNIVGNTTFSDREILREFDSSTGNLLSFLNQSGRYSRQALEGDLERLRSFYMDRGYADFAIEDVQVSISPDRRDIFITISVDEGDLYTVSNVRLAGQMVVPEWELRARILLLPGQTFSQAMVAFSEQLISERLGQDGYAFAVVQAIPELDEETKEVSLTFFVDPQNRVYVRRINFTGADNVEDEVFRRELRQLEGGYLSNVLLERSQVRLQRLPYVESVNFDTYPVPGSADLVDVDFEIEEGLPGSFGFSVGYSQAQGVILGGNFVHSNFLGTGNRVSLDLSGGRWQRIYDLGYTDAYRNIDGLTRTISLSYSDFTQFTSASSDFSTTSIAGGMTWTYAISERQQVRFGFMYRQAELLTSAFSSSQARDWVRQNGNPFTVPGTTDLFGTQVRSVDLISGWGLDTRNRVLFPDRGMSVRANLSATAPGSEVEYYIANLEMERYFMLRGPWRVRVAADLAYGDAYGETTALPPYRQFYGGGPGSVRGFRESTLGPRDSLRNPYGGNMMFTNQVELILPTPERFGASVRMSVFHDMGNIFSTSRNVRFFDRLGDPIDHRFDYDNLKRSVGVAVEWLAPLGLLRFSYASPLNVDRESDRFVGDQIERFQFSIGQAF
jgi:outer membrane protein insertion porin family